MSAPILPILEVIINLLHDIHYAQEQISAHPKATLNKPFMVCWVQCDVVLVEKLLGSDPILGNKSRALY